MFSRVVNNTLYLSLSSSIALCISFAFNIYLARTLGVERFGQFSFVLSFIALFSVFVQFSLHSVVIRDLAHTPAKAPDYFGNALVITLVLFLSAVVLIWLTAHLLGYPSDVRVLLYILSVGLLFDGMKRCSVSLFEAAQDMQPPAILLVVERALFVLLGLVAVILYGSVLAVVVSYVAVQVITQVTSYVLVRWRLRLKPSAPQYGVSKQLGRTAFPFFVLSLTAALYADIDKLFLFSMQTEESVGLYAAAYKLVVIPGQFSNAFHRALYPLLSMHAATDPVLLTDTYRRAMRYLTFAAVPTGIGMTIFADSIMNAVYGNMYVAGTVALQVLIWAYVLEFFNPFLSRILFAVKREGVVLTAVIVGTVANIILNILLIPIYSFLGAAVATVASAVLIFIILFLVVFRKFPDVSVSTLALKPAIAGLCMWIFCILLGDQGPVLLAVGGLSVYFACLIATRAFSAEEVLALRRVLSVRMRSRAGRFPGQDRGLPSKHPKDC
jgi:O-antigen/teichoic acid export membrane protein